MPIVSALTFQNDRWLRLAGITLLCLLYTTSAGYHLQPFTTEAAKEMSFGFGVIVLVWHVVRALLFYFRRRYPAKRQQARRRLVSFGAGLTMLLVLDWLIAACRHLIWNGTLAGYSPDGQTASITVNQMTIALSVFGFDLVQAASTMLFFQVVYEVLFFVRDSTLSQNRLQQAEKEKEALRAENLQSQLDALRQQVNPHFLFNSLNVLDSLIDEDAAQARVFLDELSSVYRYLLRANRDSHLTELASELEFIQSYFHLLKTRHGAGLSLEIAVPEWQRTHRLPPLTLQLLVENAVKHNVVLPDRPLHITISTTGEGRLQVCNNLQRKTMRVASSGLGLGNILAKYDMLGQPAPDIREAEGLFTVTLPLIGPAS